ncbi:ROK family protein [Geotoga petraea]|jgi:glucokinase|uniref:Glucokinase n=1 Tax=Geotoga petraea TaxID=28234 RepID=A0A1G6MWR7_9BACT|nr:ROK family protein [Geotoga petraea]MDK2946219.1 glucokinase [Geotoga sp.]TGG87315.1 ROK family protein [Geotoga petraea]SDC59982.1 glucokinase [Geotoga petraea]
MKLIGIDLGGTEIKAGLVDEDKGLLKKTSRPTEVYKGPDKIVENIYEVVKSLSPDLDIDAIGIGSPGSIDRKKGIVRFSPNFPEWHDFKLSKKLNKLTNKDVFVENDANSFTLGEWYFGKAKGMKNFVAITLGTGVGSGVVTHGVFMTGNDGIGAELGHIVVIPNGPLCGCGNRGCLESIASAKSVARHAKELAIRYPDSLVLKMAQTIENIESKHVFKAFEQGDYLAKTVVQDTIDAMARAFGAYIHIFNPEMIVVGGGMSKAGETLFKPLRERVKKYIMRSFIDTYRIEQSDLVENAGILGAASAAIFQTREEK